MYITNIYIAIALALVIVIIGFVRWLIVRTMNIREKLKMSHIETKSKQWRRDAIYQGDSPLHRAPHGQAKL